MHIVSGFGHIIIHSTFNKDKLMTIVKQMLLFLLLFSSSVFAQQTRSERTNYLFQQQRNLDDLLVKVRDMKYPYCRVFPNIMDDTLFRSIIFSSNDC